MFEPPLRHTGLVKFAVQASWHLITYEISYVMNYVITCAITYVITYVISYVITYVMKYVITYAITYVITYAISYAITYVNPNCTHISSAKTNPQPPITLHSKAAKRVRKL